MTMLTKTGFAVALVLATASGALASTKTHAVAPDQNVYNPMGAYSGTDSRSSIPFEPERVSDHGRY
jgi:hypothetical protein